MRGYINLGFYQGAVLADPERLLEGTGKGLRHVKIAPWPTPTALLFGRWWQRQSPGGGVVPPVRPGVHSRAARGERDLTRARP